MGGFLSGIAGNLGLTSWMANGALFLGGTLLVSLPIIIHLFNKRRFKIVEWAAMEFLLEADRKNRRRVRLENLLLLLLRCLAVLLLAALVGRPAIRSQLAGNLLDAQGVEHVVVLDDSMSMRTVTDESSAMDRAKESLRDLAESLQNESQDHRLTILRSSDPHHPVLSNWSLTGEQEDLVKLNGELDKIEASDTVSGLSNALTIVRDMAEETTSAVARQLYVISDLRLIDWPAAVEGSTQLGPAELLREISESDSGIDKCTLLDVGEDLSANLAVTDINVVHMSSQKSVVFGSTVRFDVTVRNNGSEAAANVEVKLSPEEGTSQVETINEIAALSEEVISFSYHFPDNPTDSDGNPVERFNAGVTVELVQSSLNKTNDQLTGDNIRYFPTEVSSGTQVLIVDGDFSDTETSESYFLKRALSPLGTRKTGLSVNVIGTEQFKGAELENYELVYLLNVPTLDESRLVALEKWVSEGGGLVLALGFLVTPEYYNTHLYRDGEGLLPFRLSEIEGDVQKKEAITLTQEDRNHAVLGSLTKGSGAFLMSRVKVYLHWSVELDQDKVDDGLVTVPMRLNDENASPVIVEHAFGEGRVMALTVPMDKDWSNWPDEAAYWLTTVPTAHYMASGSEYRELLTGEPIRYRIDLAEYRRDAQVTLPEGDPVLAVPQIEEETETDDASTSQTDYLVGHDNTRTAGFYELLLDPHPVVGEANAELEPVMYAMNVDPSESDLRRASPEGLQNQLGEGVTMITADSDGLGDLSGSDVILWRKILIFLVLVLCGEQFLALWFARRR